jgi:hypothetical protein
MSRRNFLCIPLWHSTDGSTMMWNPDVVNCSCLVMCMIPEICEWQCMYVVYLYSFVIKCLLVIWLICLSTFCVGIYNRIGWYAPKETKCLMYRTSEYHVYNRPRYLMGCCDCHQQLCVRFLPRWCHRVLPYAAINISFLLPACIKSGVYVATAISGYCVLIKESRGGAT